MMVRSLMLAVALLSVVPTITRSQEAPGGVPNPTQDEQLLRASNDCTRTRDTRPECVVIVKKAGDIASQLTTQHAAEFLKYEQSKAKQMDGVITVLGRNP